MTHQGRRQHILDQSGFTRTTDAGHTHQALERNLDMDLLEIVLSYAFKNQPRRVFCYQPLETHAYLFAPTQIGARKGICPPQVLRRAIKYDLPALLAGARAHIDHPICCQHDCGVVFNYHQGVARVPQALHRLNDAVHIAWMKSNAGLIQNKKGIDQRRTQRSSQIDALNLSTRQRATLSIKREISNSHVTKVFQTRCDFLKQQLESLRIAAFIRGVQEGKRARVDVLHRLEEPAEPVNGQQHQVMQTKARQSFELVTSPFHALRHESPGWLQCGISIRLATHSPLQTFRFQSCAAADPAGRVAPVFGKQHTNVHLVRLGFQVLKKPVDAKPVLVPFAIPVG